MTQVAGAICRSVLHATLIPDAIVTTNGLIVLIVSLTRDVAVIHSDAKHVIRHIIECRRA